MVFQILPNKLNYTVGEQVTIQVTGDPNVIWDLSVYKSGNSIELYAKTGTGSLAFNISGIIQQNGAGDYQITGANRYVAGYDTVVIHVTEAISVSGKEYVFEFSGQIKQHSLIVFAATKIVALLGGKSVYIEGGNKLVVVM